MAKKNVHVVPTDAGWAVKREGQQQAISSHRTQRTAEEAAGVVARRDGVERVTHRPDGRIRDKDSFGNDPNPPKDTKH